MDSEQQAKNTIEHSHSFPALTRYLMLCFFVFEYQKIAEQFAIQIIWQLLLSFIAEFVEFST